jgi:serine/threonine-protein kinase
MLSAGITLKNLYRISQHIGGGGFGEVYLAFNIKTNTRCAVKQNTDNRPEAIKQFELEAGILKALHHPNLVRVFDSFEDKQLHYLVMEYIEGDTLEDIVAKTGPLAEDSAIEVVVQICDALTYLHSQTPQVIHRDINIRNIKVTPQGKAILIDFGLVKELDPTASRLSPTKSGARGVTPGFSPPEQYSGGGRTNARSDIYALGATFYYLLTSQVPEESIQLLQGTPLISPRHYNSAITPFIEQIILRAIELDPQKRFQSAQQFKDTLRPAPTQPQLTVIKIAPTSFDLRKIPRELRITCEMTLQNIGKNDLHAQLDVSPVPFWLGLPQTRSFDLAPNASVKIDFRVDTRNILTAQTQHAKIDVIYNGGQEQIPVSFEVDPKAIALDPDDPSSVITSIQDFFNFCDKHWAQAKQMLKARLANCLGFLGFDVNRVTKYLLEARADREPDRQLEAFLRLLGRPAPLNPLRDNSPEVAKRLRRGQNATLRLENPNPRGYLYGEIKLIAPWVVVKQPEFGVLPGETINIYMTIDQPTYKIWRPCRDDFELFVLLPQTPKIIL